MGMVTGRWRISNEGGGAVVTQSSPGVLLIGDVGGTKTDLALFARTPVAGTPLARGQFRSADYPGLVSMVRAFLAQTGLRPEAACFDVAGPVVGGRAHLTNLPWSVDEDMLRHDLGFASVWVINDLVAIAHAVPLLATEDLHVLNPGAPVMGGAIAVIAPGTGLGEAYLVWDGSRYRDFPSEGGHADFAPPTTEYLGLLHYLQQRLGHVSYEMVCSGLGIPYLYEYFRDSGLAPETPEFCALLAAAADRTPLIIDAALGRGSSSKLCSAVLDAFVTILGAEAGNLALKVLATGGVFIGGGIPPRMLSALSDGRFMNAFKGKGRFAELLRGIPVRVITNADVALLGAAHYARTQEGEAHQHGSGGSTGAQRLC